MDNRPAGGFWVILLSFVFALLLMVVSLPESLPWELGYLRPDWVGLVLFYWVIALPHRIGVMVAWFLGIAVDVLVGSLLGQHGIAMIFIAYIAVKLHQRLRMFAIWQQSLIVFITIGGAQLLNVWIENFVGVTEWSFWYLLPAFISALMWPWVFMVLRFLRRFFYVN